MAISNNNKKAKCVDRGETLHMMCVYQTKRKERKYISKLKDCWVYWDRLPRFMVGAIKEKKRKTQMWGRHSKRLYLCTVPTNVRGFFSSSSSSSFTTPRCYAIGHTKTLYRREFQRKCHITSLATALPIERRSRITYDGGADWSIETEWMWQNCRCSSYFIALQEEYKQRTKNRFYILYIPMCIERLCDGGRQSHVINMEHWANMTGVSTDRRTRSIISLYSIRKKKRFCNFQQITGSIDDIYNSCPSVLLHMYVPRCEGDQPMCKRAWRQ